VTPGPDGDRVVLRFAESGWFAAWLVGYGSDVVVLDPPEVRDEVVARLRGLLNLVPYLLARPGIRIVEAADDLGVTERQLREDLELLWVCGLPGYGPGDLIDMAFDGDTVTITYDAGIDRPLRLNQEEALALVVALRMLAEVPGVGHRD